MKIMDRYFDNNSERVVITAVRQDNQIYLRLIHFGDVALTPSEARYVADALHKAADVAKKPRKKRGG